MQAVTFLVIHQKHKKSLEEITNDLCPVLSVQQLYRISTMYWDDRYNTETVAHEVRSSRVYNPGSSNLDAGWACPHSKVYESQPSIRAVLSPVGAGLDH